MVVFHDTDDHGDELRPLTEEEYESAAAHCRKMHPVVSQVLTTYISAQDKGDQCAAVAGINMMLIQMGIRGLCLASGLSRAETDAIYYAVAGLIDSRIGAVKYEAEQAREKGEP